MTYWTTELALPFRSQLETWTIDGQYSENSANDCAETCMASVIEYVTGVRLPIDAINDWLYAEGHVGPTPASKIRGFLSTYCHIPTTDLSAQVATTQGNGPGSLLNLVWSYTVRGLPLIELRQYSPTNSTLHWVDVLGCDATNAFVMDPWGGVREVKTYADHCALYRGTLLGVDRVRDPNL